jgi:hypothetical protein
LLRQAVSILAKELEFGAPNGDSDKTIQVPTPAPRSGKVFVVHGHDEAALQAVARFLEQLGLEAIILREQPGVQDRDGGIWLLATLFGQFPFLAKLFADSAYAGPIFNTALDKVLPNLKDAQIVPKIPHTRSPVLNF